MDQGTRRVELTEERANGSIAPRQMSQALGGEVAVVREELDVLLAELDRRRHDFLDVRLQLQRHGVGIALTTLAFVGTAAGGVWLTVWRQRRRQSLSARADRLGEAMSRLAEHPERVAAEPTMAGKIVTAAASAAAASLVRKVLEHAVRRLMDPQRDMRSALKPRHDQHQPAA
jgi:hypothetical protein